MTLEERIEDLKNKIRSYYNINKKSKVKLFYGDLKDVGNNILVVAPPQHKFFESEDDKIIINILSEFRLFNYFLTYYYLIPNTKPSKQDIKNFGFWIRNIVDILEPKLIVCVGEDAQFSFYKSKFIIRDYHGLQIGEYNSIPIFASYIVPYYSKKADTEDMTYKNFIKNKDWSNIKKKYDEVINVESS
jgi:hypothetical protein